jgi:hypothetical protein
MLYREKYGNPGMPTTVFLIDYLSSTWRYRGLQKVFEKTFDFLQSSSKMYVHMYWLGGVVKGCQMVYQKSKFGWYLEGLTHWYPWGIFYAHLVHFTVMRYILHMAIHKVCIVCGHLDYLRSFGIFLWQCSIFCNRLVY